MVKSYLRYRPGPVQGLISQPSCNVSADRSGRTLATGLSESIGTWNVRRGALVNTLTVTGDDASARCDATQTTISPNGLQVAVGYSDGMIRIFDVAKTTLLMALTGHKKSVSALAFSEDGTLLVSGSKDTDIIVWDLVSETGLVRFRGHKDEVTSVLLVSSPGESSGQLLISSSKDTLMKVWDLRTRMCVQTIVGVRSEVWSLSASRTVDGTRVYAGAGDNLLRAWTVGPRPALGGSAAPAAGGSAAASEPLQPLGAVIRTTHDRASGVACSADGRYVAVQSAGRSIEVFKRRDAAETRKRVLRRLRRVREKTAKKTSKSSAAAASKRKREDEDGSDSGSEAGSTGPSGPAEGETAGDDNAEFEADFGDSGLFGTSLADLDAAIARLEEESRNAEAGAGQGAVTASGAAGVPVIASDELELVGIAQASAKIASFCILEQSGDDLTGPGGRPMATLQLLASLTDNRMEVHTLPLDADAQKAMGTKTFAAANGSILPLAANTRSIAQAGHRSDVRAVAVNDDGSLALTTSVGEAKLWNAKTGVCLRTLSLAVGHKDTEGEAGEAGATAATKAGSTGLCCAFGPGAKHGFIGTKDGRLLSFDLSSGDRLEEHQAHDGPLWSLAVRPDGKGLMTGGADKEVKFWEFELIDQKEYLEAQAALASGEGGKKKGKKAPEPSPDAPQVKVLTVVHTRTLKVGDEVLCVAYSKHTDPAKLLVAVSLLDATVKLFHDDSLKFFLSLYGHKLPVLAMDVSGDGTLLATGSADKSVKVWGLDFGDCHRSFPAHSDSVTAVAWLGNTHYFLSGSKDRSVRYWDGDRFERILSLDGYHKGEVWGIAAAKDGKFFVSVGADRSIRTWRRTNEQVFLEEEKEKALEDAINRDVKDADGDEALGGADMVGPLGADGLAVATDNDDGRVATAAAVSGTGLLSEATTIVAHATKATGKGAERLTEALALAASETEKWKEYAEDLEAARADEAAAGSSAGAGSSSAGPAGVNPPQPNPELLGLTPSAYVLRTLRTVRPADVDQVLLTLPFPDALQLLRFCAHLLRHGQGVELVSRAVLLLLRVHGPQIASSPSLLPFVTSLQTSMQATVGATADAIGYNSAALGFMDSSLAEQLASDEFGTEAEGQAKASMMEGRPGAKKDKKDGKASDGIKIGKRRKVQLF